MDHYNTYINQLLSYEIRCGLIKVENDSEALFAQICDLYPTVGSKIDWGAVPESVQEFAARGQGQTSALVGFFNTIVVRNDLHGSVKYAGDSAIELTYEGPIGIFQDKLEGILHIPQHHYFCDLNLNWCMALTMEGDMCFGYRPGFR